MIMIAAALGEELKTAMELCRLQKKIPTRSVSLWQADRGGKKILFLKTGVGPRRSAEKLEAALNEIRPSSILVIGYAGALDPDLKLGDLVVPERALAFSLDKKNPDWEHVQLNGVFPVSNSETLIASAKSSGLEVRVGDVLTSSYVLGDPVHKRLLFDKFRSLIVDMETAALVRVAASLAVPLGCIRAVSDEAADTFLAPFSYDPSTPMTKRARKLVGEGMTRIYREWRNHAKIARKTLEHFLSGYL